MNTDQRAVADAVRDQLKDDYPPEALDWVDTVDWDGPVDVPVSEIDTSNRSNWIASYEPEKVARFIDAIESGDPNKPIVLYRTPDGAIHIADGHHRFLAAEQMGTPAVSSYVAQVESVDGPWRDMHEQQNSGPSIKDDLEIAPPSTRSGYGVGKWADKFLAH